MEENNSKTEFNLPGRLGDPDMQLAADPRFDARLFSAMKKLGLLEPEPKAPVTSDSDIEDLINFSNIAEQAWEEENERIYADVMPHPDVDLAQVTIDGVDGNEIEIYIHRPSGSEEILPGVLYLHGGGMVMLSTTGAIYQQWRDELSLAGLVAVGVEFRNAGGRLGPHPFPAGLNDCISALKWMHKNRESLGISGIVVSGESGGGNLSIATCLKAKKEGFLGHIQGIYAQAPIVANAYSQKDPGLMSLYECDGYAGLELGLVAALTRLYDPEQKNTRNPLAWPMYATEELLTDLPPHFVSVNELDPHRDEGIAYVRKLVKAGVMASSRTINGTHHVADMKFRDHVPDIFFETISSIKAFAERVTS